MKVLIIILVLFSLSSAKKYKNYGNATVSRVIYVYDGDTFRCDLLNMSPIVGENVGIRIKGIDTPEMRDKRPHIKAKAVEARDYVRERLAAAEKIELVGMQRGKYFRIVATILVDGANLSKELIEKGLALPYDGGKKAKWE